MFIINKFFIENWVYMKMYLSKEMNVENLRVTNCWETENVNTWLKPIYCRGFNTDSIDVSGF
jgi:hypothetical protein